MVGRRQCAAAVVFASLYLTVGCAPEAPKLVTSDNFLPVVDAFALAPDLSCDDLKTSFGMPHVPSVMLPDEIGIPFEEHFVTTPRGESLRLWYIPGRMQRGTIVISMGAAGDMSCFLFLAHMLRTHGWSVVLFDYQGFGQSTGEPTIDSLYADLQAVLDWTFANRELEQVTLLGVSIGTLPVAALAVDQPTRINGIVLDAAISVRHEVERLGFLLAGDVDDFVGQFEAWQLLDVQLAQVTQPTLVYRYGLDEYATSESFAEIAPTITAPLTMVWLDQVGHARGPYQATGEYFYQLEMFLASLSAAPE